MQATEDVRFCFEVTTFQWGRERRDCIIHRQPRPHALLMHSSDAVLLIFGMPDKLLNIKKNSQIFLAKPQHGCQ